MQILRPFFLGILAAILALVLELFFSFSSTLESESLFQKVSWILVVFVLIEEIIKIAFIWENFSASINKISKLQIFFQSLLIGLGFALTEAALKTSGLLLGESRNFTSYIPFFGAIVIHIGTSGLIGFLLTKTNKVSPWTFLQMLLIAFGWHFLFNFFEIQIVNPWIMLVFLLSLGLFVVLAGFRIATFQKTYTQ
jgi:RsiW-degrading membrane proteinase PrsW (M82 family)